MTHEVVVSNIGTVYAGQSFSEAKHMYKLYKHVSKHGTGRASGEDVTMLVNGTVEREYLGYLATRSDD